jgi:hypothetical protein
VGRRQRIHVAGRCSRNDDPSQGRTHATRSDCIRRLEPCLASQTTQSSTSDALLEIAYHEIVLAAPNTARGLAPSFTRPQRRSQLNLLHNGYGTPSPIHLLHEGTVGRTTVLHHCLAFTFTFTIRRTHIATSYCSPIPHLEEATAASFSISGPEEEAAAPFQHLSTLAPLPAVTLEFLQHHRSSATFVHPELSLTASSTVFTDCPHCPFGQTSEIHSTLQLLSPLMFTSNTSLVRNSQPWNLCIPVLGDSPLRSR